MIKNRFNYWSCSKLADIIRGEKKPFALEWGEWNKWKDKQSQQRPIRFWLSDTLLNRVQDLVYLPLDIYDYAKNYVQNRWIDKTHYLKTGLKPGYYYEFEHRILHALFNELVEYVEIECGHLSLWNTEKKYKLKNGRCIEAVYDYFEWSNNLTEKDNEGNTVLSEQALQSRELQKLYEWWKTQRPLRKDPSELSGWSTYYSSLNKEDDLFNNNLSKEKKEQVKIMLTKLENIEDMYYDEDTDMLIRLIKLRKFLWI